MNLTAKITLDPNNGIIGRIGGNIPNYFSEKKELIDGYKFYIWFFNPDDNNEVISVFVPDSYDNMIDNDIYPNCSIKVFSHPFSEESEDKDYTIEYITKSNLVGFEKVESDIFNFITVSEKPNLIQNESFYYSDLEKDNYEFYIQIDEDYYPDNLVEGNYIFGYGALYLYKHIETSKIIAGFWQYS